MNVTNNYIFVHISVQMKFMKSKYGTLTVRTFYLQNKLHAEIISASNLFADDDISIWSLCKKITPSSDPYVKLKLRPIENFESEVPYTKYLATFSC